MGKTLIIYYSRTGENYVNGAIINLQKGNTEIVAEYLKEATGKNVYSVMTHEGSGLGQSVGDLKKVCKGAIVGKGLAIHGADAKESRQAVEDWIKENIG